MPRKSPDKVTEHRMTLGNWEREKIQNVEDAITTTAKATATASLLAGSASILLPVGVGVAGLGVGAGLYFGLREFSFGDGDLIGRIMGKNTRLGREWAKSQARGDTTVSFVAKQVGNKINDSVIGKTADKSSPIPEPLSQKVVREFIDLLF